MTATGVAGDETARIPSASDRTAGARPYTWSMASDPWLTISALPLFQFAPLIVVGYVLLRQPVNLMIGVERPMLRRFVTVIGALVACRLFLSFPS